MQKLPKQIVKRKTKGCYVVAGPENRDKDLGLADLPGETVGNCNGLTGIINKEFFTGTVLMAHGNI